ncbi:MAG: transcriptional repressor [Candidatus Hydrothermarchaeaceae archaeon]
MKTIGIIDKFRKRGRKVTPQRLAVFKALEGNTSHPTAEDLHRMLTEKHPTITLATVYQTLNILRDDGELTELNIGGDRRHYDPDTSLHHHAVCSVCGSVSDVKGLLEIDFPDPAQDQNFDFTGYHVEFYGTCGSCRN